MASHGNGAWRRIRRAPWFVWVGVATFIVIGAALLVFGSWGRDTQRGLATLEARLETEGRGVTRADFLASHAAEAHAPRVAAFLDWVTQDGPDPITGLLSPRASGMDAREAAYFGSERAVAAELLAWRDAWLDHGTALEALFAAGLTRASGAAVEHERERGHAALSTFDQMMGPTRMDPRWSLDDLAAAYHMEALYGDTSRALAGLDRLRALLTPVTTVEDIERISNIDKYRDRTYLALALRGRLPRASAARWLAEKPPSAVEFAEALRGRRLTETLPKARAYAAGEHAFYGPSSATGFEGAGERFLYTRYGACADIIRTLEMQLVVEDVLRGAAPVASLPAMEIGVTTLESLLLQGMDDIVKSSRQWLFLRSRHRMFRMAVRLVGGGPAPTERELAGGPFDFALRHQASGAGRNLLTRDPSVPVPRLAFPEFDIFFERMPVEGLDSSVEAVLHVGLNVLAWRKPAAGAGK